jgi:hypothetical protein
MTGIEWYSAPRAALVRMERIGGHTVGGTVGGFVAVILIGAAVLLWNSYSNGGVVRVLGGVTSQELFEEIAAHPGPQGPPGPAGPPGDAEVSATNVPVVRLVAQTGTSHEKSGPIAGSEAYPVCALSKVTLHRDVKNPDGSCQLKRGTQSGGQWEVIVSGATCSVTCFTLSTSK